ncbi:hypothetical protein [Gracilibacillus sp. Marseille-QA3620]
MKKFVYICLTVLCLSGCIGENYSVGHPITKLQVNDSTYDLKPSKVQWQTQGDSTSLDEDNIEALLSESKKITVSQGQFIKIKFEDSIEDEGEYTDIQIKISVTQNDSKQLLYEKDIDSSMLEEIHTFASPTENGNYILEVEFSSNGNYAQYIGNLYVE